MNQKINQNIIKKADNSIVKKYTPEEAKRLIIQLLRLPIDVEVIAKELADEILPRIYDGSIKGREKADKKLSHHKKREILLGLGLETHAPLIEAVDEDYRGLIKDICSQFIRDCGCKTSIEKALAEVAANAYIRVIDNSKRLNNDLGHPGQIISENKTKYLAMLSKQLDRANRQFLAAITTLKQIKMPAIEMIVKTNNAFIAQNQAIKTDHPNDETIESK